MKGIFSCWRRHSNIFNNPIYKANLNLQLTYFSTILVDRVGSVTTIGINRPEKRNCVNVETAQYLEKAIENFENDESSLVGVLYGKGGNFCSGYDLHELAATHGDKNLLKQTENTAYPTSRYIKKPLVAAISGYAVGFGLELALMCDLLVIEETAVLGVYNRRFGVPLVNGGTVRLQAAVGLSRALDLILTGRSLSGKEAFEWGLACRIVACGTSLGQAISVASSLVKFPQKCLLKDRKSTYSAAFSFAYQELLQIERENAAEILQTEAVEGAKKFVSGIGRHGKSYNLTEKKTKSWESD